VNLSGGEEGITGPATRYNKDLNKNYYKYKIYEKIVTTTKKLVQSHWG
jgi:hypothetical protein